MALLHLMHQWSEIDFVCATVDHNLRPQARREAETVGEWAQALGRPHQILTWHGPKPTAGLQAQARTKRYQLLFDYARHAGADGIVTAHHLDDQAETVLMRLCHGSGIAGLAAMSVARPINGLIHWRPLLSVTKKSLRQLCHDCGQAYFEDPSNQAPQFMRARIRQMADSLSLLGLHPHHLALLAQRAARSQQALEAVAAQMAQQWSDPKSVDYLLAQPEEIALRLLAIQIERYSGGRYQRLEKLERAWQKLAQAASEGKAVNLTIGGLKLTLKRDRSLLFIPEGDRRRGRRPSVSAQA